MLSDQEKAALKARVLNAWNSIKSEDREQIKVFLDLAHQDYRSHLMGHNAIQRDAAPHHVLIIKSILTDDWDGLLQTEHSIRGMGLFPRLTDDGEIVGFGDYELLDYGWAESFAVWLEYLYDRCNFNTNPQIIQVANDIKIAIAGDWGAPNFPPSLNVANSISQLSPNITIHLGDVYYSGTEDQEQYLISKWPKGSPDSSLTFTLNSNHEMYSGAYPYFQDALSTAFQKQNGCSYFALENSNWVIVCLDSAYHSPRLKMYMSGNIDEDQIEFLRVQSEKGKKLIVMSHHNGISEDDEGNLTLNSFWDQIYKACPNNKPAYWYWGHVHTGVVYAEQEGNIKARCCGHGSMPHGHSSVLENAKANGNVIWYEDKNAADPTNDLRIYNGFAVIELNGSQIKETYYNEIGGQSWASGVDA